MTCPSIFQANGSVNYENPVVMGLSAVPLVGIIVNLVAVTNLSKELNTFVTRETVGRTIETAKLLKSYNKLSIFRELLSAALIIAGIAFEILSISALGSAVCFLALAAYNFYRIHLVNKDISRLERQFAL